MGKRELPLERADAIGQGLLDIGRASKASGVSVKMIRHYEEIGLLPQPARTPSGYRTYDDRTLERLAFIARAKQLGCTLDEIADLTTAWDGGRCGPVQERLRGLVADKLAAARGQIVELSTLSGELSRAAEALERHRPDGPLQRGHAAGRHPDPGQRQRPLPGRRW